jgi:hypothetical protein
MTCACCQGRPTVSGADGRRRPWHPFSGTTTLPAHGRNRNALLRLVAYRREEDLEVAQRLFIVLRSTLPALRDAGGETHRSTLGHGKTGHLGIALGHLLAQHLT